MRGPALAVPPGSRAERERLTGLRAGPSRNAIAIAIAAALAALFVAIRWPLYTSPGLVLGWNSDAALFGLMARAMADGSDFPLFFWGQRYLGTLTSMLTAAIAAGGEIGPLALRIAASLEVALSIVLFASGLRRAFGGRAAALASLWLVAGPAFLFHFTIAPIGAEQLLLAAAALFWFVMRSPMTAARSWLAAGLLFGFGMYLHQGVMFLGGAIAVALLVERLFGVKRVLAGLLGAAVGYLPAAVVLIRKDVLLYSRTIAEWDVVERWAHLVETLTSDVWLLISDATIAGVAAGCVLIAYAALGMRGGGRGRTIALWTIVFSGGFWILSTYPYPGAVRYIVPALPMLYAFAAAGMLRWWDRGGSRRVIALLAIALTAVPMYAARVRQARDVAAGRAEQYTNWPGGFDPRPVLQAIRDGGYPACYGEAWVAHKLEFLTEPAVPFIVVRGVHRTLPRSLTLIARPGRKCWVGNDGSIRPLSPEEERMHRAGVEWRARRAGLRLHWTRK